MLAGETMLGRQTRLLRSVSRVVAVVGRDAASPGPERSSAAGSWADGLPLLRDAFSGRGPLAGVYTALSWTRTEFNLFLGCDLPSITTPFLRYLTTCALSCQADVTVPQSREHRYQPLCAVYRRRVLPVIRARLARGENKVSGFFPSVVCRVVSWPEIASAGFPAGIFANMNAPEEYQAAKRRLEPLAACRGFSNLATERDQSPAARATVRRA